MIKHLLTTLCALALVTAGSIPALAAEADTSESTHYYPVSVESTPTEILTSPASTRCTSSPSPTIPPESPRRTLCGMGGCITCWI